MKVLQIEVNCQFGSTDGNGYPFFVQWHLTEKCNLQCVHCYQRAPVGEMAFDAIRGAIDRLADTVQYWAAQYEIEVSPSIHFTGGEPLLRPELIAILSHARSRGFATSLMSNGTLITEARARELKEAGVSDIQVSLDGTESVHDSMRGRGAFAKAVAGIRHLVASGIETNINLTVSERNYKEIDPLLGLAEKLGAKTVGFSRLVPCGRGKKLLDDVLTPEHLAQLSRQMEERSQSCGVRLVSRDPLIGTANIPEGADIPQSDFPLSGCSAGIFGVTITADGTIMPCRRMDLPIGNILTDDFRELWVESPVLAALRDRRSYNGNCRTCRYWTVCRGCRAIALAASRSGGAENYLGSDPQCISYTPV